MAADPTYGPSNYMTQSGAELFIGGKITVGSGAGILPPSGTKPTLPSTTVSGTSLGTTSTQVDAIVVALRNVGIVV